MGRPVGCSLPFLDTAARAQHYGCVDDCPVDVSEVRPFVREKRNRRDAARGTESRGGEGLCMNERSEIEELASVIRKRQANLESIYSGLRAALRDEIVMLERLK